MNIIKKYPPLDLMKKSGAVLKEALLIAGRMIKPGITTRDINKAVHMHILSKNMTSAFLGYNGYSAVCCICVNEEIVHCIPSDKKLCEGDIVSVDCGVNNEGAITDACRTFIVGKTSPDIKHLVKTVQNALEVGIGNALVGNRVGDISSSIQTYVESLNFTVSKEFGGHFIGYALHEDPWVPNFGRAGIGKLLEGGEYLAIEPVIFMGSSAGRCLDGWNTVSPTGVISAHFENTIYIHKDGPIVLTE